MQSLLRSHSAQRTDPITVTSAAICISLLQILQFDYSTAAESFGGVHDSFTNTALSFRSGMKERVLPLSVDTVPSANVKPICTS